MTRFAALVLALLQGGESALPASGVRVGASVSPASVRVGEPVVLTVRLQVAAGARVRFPDAVDSTERAEPLDPVIVVDTLRGEVREYTARYRFVAWRVGPLRIPLAPVMIERDGRQQQLDVGPPPLEVVTVLPVDTTLRTPRPARGIFTKQATPWWLWGLGLSVPMLLAAAWAWRRWSQQRADTAPVLSPEQEARAAFEALEALGLPAMGEPTRHAIAAAAILRAYLAATRVGDDGGLTASELVAALAPQDDDPDARVRALLERLDAVQFAGEQLGAEQAIALAAEAQALCLQAATARARRGGVRA